MTVSSGLVADLQRRVRLLEGDLRAQSDDPSNVWGAALRSEHSRALSRGRTGLSWSEWRDGEVAQAAVAWVLACVFVRFCEDNGLIDGVWLAGPGERTARAVDAETAFYTEVPSRTATNWLRESFGALAGVPAGRGLVDPAHSPVWSVGIGPDVARELVAFWRETGADGELLRDFTDAELNTRFLGDLYQDLSEFAKKKYALLQTPVFVEEFILDRTLTPALEEFGLEGLRLIDPTCGSGHFLLGAFGRLVEAWAVHAPGLTPEARVQRALDSVHGVDLNPFAVAIARFRLTVAALKASGITSLSKAPAFAYHVAVGDSLLAGTAGRQGDLLATEDDSLASFEYAAEDVSEYPGILDPGRYHVVVGNPPYITVKDKALNQAYRDVYSTCSGTYALSVPFMERFFQLAQRGDGSQPAGFVGQITSNSFMKREFGKKLIEEFLSGGTFATPVDVHNVIDTSGAYIPGHGTPTVILIGRTRQPAAETVRVVLGTRGEPGQPADPAMGLVWSEIVRLIDDANAVGEFVSVADWTRQSLALFPWSLRGGGASDLTDRLRSHPRRLGDLVESIGRVVNTVDDSFFIRPVTSGASSSLQSLLRPIVDGDEVRDWTARKDSYCLYAYDGTVNLLPEARRLLVESWPFRLPLMSRRLFGRTMADRGLREWALLETYPARVSSPLLIVFSMVATHNHFSLLHRDLAKHAAPVIKLPVGSSEAEHLDLLGVLNSSTACFWLKQVSHQKGGGLQSGGGEADQPWSWSYEFTGTKLQEFPLPVALPRERARVLDRLVLELAQAGPKSVVDREGVSREALDSARRVRDRLRARMVFEQEELDWEVYRAYGLIEDDLTYAGSALDMLLLGERTFEIALARRVARGTEETAWFDRHGSTPITEPPSDWPSDYLELYYRRHEAISANHNISLLERPEFKRRWASRSWEELERGALTEFVLDRLEAPGLWSSGGSPGVVSVARLADRVRGDEQLVEALRLLTGQQDVDVTAELSRLVAGECVPFLAAYRYTETGLVKRAEWESVWALQRREDAGEKVDIPVPPKYTNKDFVKGSYWSARGKLDVPKERFVSFPGLERAGDSTLVLGWAGWDHLEQARALASAISQGVQEEGWGRDRLVPLLAGLLELEPWLHQWHDDPDPVFGGSPAVFMSAFLDGELDRLGLTRTDLATWRPAAASRGRGRKAAAGQEEIDS